MYSSKRALLIASPYADLKGPLEDVQAVEEILGTRGFTVLKCCGADATRDRIIESWRKIINEAECQDTVIVYYSGHGGLVEDEVHNSDENSVSTVGKEKPWRYQFIVPMDFGETTTDKFCGILDVELSHLLRDTTNKTENVTIILDCCHSGRMARDPKHGDEAMPRSINKVQHHNITNHIKVLRETGQLKGETALLGNQSAVRVAAAATTEVAWSYRNSNGIWRGAMTEALLSTLADSVGQNVPWRTSMIRVREVVNIEFPDQHPSIDGPDTRIPFSLIKQKPGGFLAKVNDGRLFILAGRVSGVRVGNVYTIMPLGAGTPDTAWLGEATVTQVIGFKAAVDVVWRSSGQEVPAEGVLCYLKEETLERFPVVVPRDLPDLEKAVRGSNLLRPREQGEDHAPLAYFRCEGKKLVLAAQSGAETALEMREEPATAKQTTITEIVRVAEQLARAQHLLGLKPESSEKLSHGLAVTVGTVLDGKPDMVIEQNGKGVVAEQDLLYVALKNGGPNTIFVSVLDINAIGKISMVSHRIELRPDREYILGNDEFGLGLRGLRTTWPKALSNRQSIDEHFILIVTDTSVDLNHLTASNIDEAYGRGALSDLERLIYKVVMGRDVHFESSSTPILFDIVHIPFSLRPLQYEQPKWFDSAASEHAVISAEDLPSPESVIGSFSIPSAPDSVEPGVEVRNIFGAVIRFIKHIPPYVKVVNEHTEEITVVVSKYRPNRLLTEGGVNASGTGAGIDLKTTIFTSPVTRKKLAAKNDKVDSCKGCFPLWTRRAGFGVITIFKGPEQKTFIENDQIMAGVTAYFTGVPDLRIVNRGGEPVVL